MTRILLYLYSVVVAVGLGVSPIFSASLCGGALVCGIQFLPPAPKEAARPQAFRAFSDRHVYWANDPVAHIVVSFLGDPGLSIPNHGIEIYATDGTGTADCYPTKNGKVYIPPIDDPVWEAYANAAVAEGLTAGYNWTRFKDAPHVELEAD